MATSLIFARQTRALLATAMIAVVFVPGLAQGQNNPGDDNSRGVRIIDAPTPPPGAGGSQDPKSPSVETPSPPLLTPASPSPTVAVPSLSPPAVAVSPVPSSPAPIVGETHPTPVLVAPAPDVHQAVGVPVLVPPVAPRPNPGVDLGATVPVPPALVPSSPTPGPHEATTPPPAPNNFAGLPKPPDNGAASTQGNLAVLSGAIKIPNTAGLAMQILPGPDIVVGSQVSFQISSKKPGYLILLDVDATGKLTQIYPNPMSLTGGTRENSNFLRPGKLFRIPDRSNVFSGFEFIASPPAGTAMVVAILSDRPVQKVDLPDVPASLLGSPSAVDYLTKVANELRIPDAGGTGRFDEAHWSFDAKFYAIR